MRHLKSHLPSDLSQYILLSQTLHEWSTLLSIGLNVAISLGSGVQTMSSLQLCQTIPTDSQISGQDSGGLLCFQASTHGGTGTTRPGWTC